MRILFLVVFYGGILRLQGATIHVFALLKELSQSIFICSVCFICLFNIGCVTTYYQWEYRGGISAVWVFSSVYYVMTNMDKIQIPSLKSFWSKGKIIYLMAHNSGSVITWPGIGLKLSYTLWSIQMKSIKHKKIHFMRLGRLCACGMKTWTSISPLDGSHGLTSTSNFGPTITLAQSLYFCLGIPIHLGMNITLYVAGYRIFCLL